MFLADPLGTFVVERSLLKLECTVASDVRELLVSLACSVVVWRFVVDWRWVHCLRDHRLCLVPGWRRRLVPRLVGLLWFPHSSMWYLLHVAGGMSVLLDVSATLV